MYLFLVKLGFKFSSVIVITELEPSNQTPRLMKCAFQKVLFNCKKILHHITLILCKAVRTSSLLHKATMFCSVFYDRRNADIFFSYFCFMIGITELEPSKLTKRDEHYIQWSLGMKAKAAKVLGRM